MSIATKSSRFVSLILALFLVVAGLTYLQLAAPTPAHADAGTCASTGACQDISTNIALNNSGSGGAGNSILGGNVSPPVVSSGGSSSAPPAIPPSCDPANPDYCVASYQTRATFNDMGPNWSGTPLDCGPKMVNGIKVNAVGYTLVERRDVLGWGSAVGFGGAEDGARYSSWYNIGTICNYPPDPTITDTNITCILSYTANIDRLAKSYLGYGARVDSRSQTVSSLSSLESNPDGCQQSINASFGTNVGRSQQDYGWYQATSQVSIANCTFGYTTFNGNTTRSGGCNDAGMVNGSVGRLTVYCGPAIHDWVQEDWTGKDCYNGGGPKCTVPNDSTFNGFTGNVQALRDGNDNNMTWKNPILSAGISGDTNWRAKTDINGGSTPYNTSAEANDKSNQLFRSNQSFGTWNYGSLPALQNQTLAFYTAGSSGSPFSMTRNYLFDANFTTFGTIITGYDTGTGAISTSSYSTTVFLKNNPCGPQASPNINAVRAIGDVITGG